MDTLNFLKFQPLANWFDYFLDRQKFFDLIADADKGWVWYFPILKNENSMK